MGQFFYFYNHDLKESNQKPILSNFGLSWAKLERLSEAETLLVFEQVMQDNNWASSHCIVAVGDYHSIITWQNGTLTYEYKE
ncbi:hypothetical protein HDU91_006943 [Kappamyces sp. JEL0680]|nr:hypothetical protein HDU91_006943 [Kappamyces sp. JEL0680]